MSYLIQMIVEGNRGELIKALLLTYLEGLKKITKYFCKDIQRAD
jgi:hypothetical protein